MHQIIRSAFCSISSLPVNSTPRVVRLGAATFFIKPLRFFSDEPIKEKNYRNVGTPLLPTSFFIFFAVRFLEVWFLSEARVDCCVNKSACTLEPQMSTCNQTRWASRCAGTEMNTYLPLSAPAHSRAFRRGSIYSLFPRI